MATTRNSHDPGRRVSYLLRGPQGPFTEREDACYAAIVAGWKIRRFRDDWPDEVCEEDFSPYLIGALRGDARKAAARVSG